MGWMTDLLEERKNRSERDMTGIIGIAILVACKRAYDHRRTYGRWS